MMANYLSTNMDKLQKRIIKVIAIAYENLSSKEFLHKEFEQGNVSPVKPRR